MQEVVTQRSRWIERLLAPYADEAAALDGVVRVRWGYVEEQLVVETITATWSSELNERLYELERRFRQNRPPQPPAVAFYIVPVAAVVDDDLVEQPWSLLYERVAG